MKVLLHVCCAPCSIQSIKMIEELGHDITAFWYNPNIHPFTEYRARKNAMIEYSKSIELQIVIEDEYGLRKFIDKVYPKYDNRCKKCYDMRFLVAAKYAAKNGYDAFTSSLFVSPYQNIELMKESAFEAAEKCGVDFLYVDFREEFKNGQNEARKLNIYMQKYCGCIFSEEERYYKSKKR